MATSTPASSSTQLTGCVKWFNNGLNYGFITVLTEGEHHNADIFVHQSNIKTKQDCFRTLYTGECVQFELAKSDNEKHPIHAVNVAGYNGTLLHCENPSYRPRRFNNQGGRGGSRGGFRGGSRGGKPRTDGTAPAATAATPVVEQVAASTETVVTSAPVAETKAPSRRGRGRGKVASA